MELDLAKGAYISQFQKLRSMHKYIRSSIMHNRVIRMIRTKFLISIIDFFFRFVYLRIATDYCVFVKLLSSV